jgi:hypothetical protein
MFLKRSFLNVAVLACALGVPAAASAAPILDAGWDYQELQVAGDPTDESPFSFTLSGWAYLRVTDAFTSGDTWEVYDEATGTPVLTTALFFPTVHPGAFGDGELPEFLDPGWTNPGTYTRGELLLAPGIYQFGITGDGVGGLAAGVGVRLDTAPAPVPEPATLLLVATGLGAAAARRRMKKRT